MYLRRISIISRRNFPHRTFSKEHEAQKIVEKGGEHQSSYFPTPESIRTSAETMSGMYSDFEQRIMTRLQVSQSRFRIILASACGLFSWGVYVWGKEIRDYFTQQTAQVARDTMAHESFQIQSQELALAVVQALLNDREVLMRATNFLRDAVSTPQTKSAMIDLATYILKHPDVQAEATKLGKDVIFNLTKDPEVVQEVISVI